MKNKLITVTIICCYIIIWISISTLFFALIKYTNNNPYLIAFMSACVSHRLLDNIIKIIKNIGDKRGWFE